MTSALPDSKSKDEQKLTIYPDYCHTLSPTIGKWVPLPAKDVHVLKDVGVFCDGRILYHFINHPIKWVKVIGVVVAVDQFKEKRVYTLDDSSGVCVECTAVAPPRPIETVNIPKHLGQLAAIEAQIVNAEEKKRGKGKEKAEGKDEKKTPSVLDPVVPWEEIDIGTIVKVKGRINNWWNQLQIEAIKIEILKGLDAEVKCWNEIREFRESVLEKPWVVTQEEEESCRKVRERELRRAKKRAREERGKDKENRDKGYTERREKEDDRSGERKDGHLVERGVDRDGHAGEAKKRKDLERVQKLDGVVKRRKETDGENLGSKNKINYPSWAVRKAAAGKYDALGI
ncbi:hypothetical protein EG329_000935 [Mollisiaceae sp. DMI_Dod_QoI]|nr:hypothetical protein EG329_000935 [Helotiales sp. DMI_Dod_QoI]